MVEGWETVTIGDFLDFKNGLNKGKEFFGHGTPIINYTDVYNHRGLVKKDINGSVDLQADEIARYDVKKGDVFFTRTSETPDEVGLASVLLEDIQDCVFSGFVLRGRPKNNLLIPEYCKYCFLTKAVREKIILNCTYTTRALTNGTQLSKIEIPVPPQKEQVAIATALTDMDNAIEALQKLIRKKKDIRQACLQHMFPRNGQKVPEWRLPGFTGDWEQRKLGDVGSTYTGLAGKTKDDFGHGNGRFVTYLNVFTNPVANGSIVEPIEIDKSQNEVKFGDVLFTTSSETPEEVGMSSVWLENSANTYLNSFCFGFRPTEAFDPYYLAYMLRSEGVRKKITFLAQGISRYNISKSKMMDIEIPVPEKGEQELLGSFFRSLDHLITLHQRKLQKYKMIKQGMMEELLTGKVRLV